MKSPPCLPHLLDGSTVSAFTEIENQISIRSIEKILEWLVAIVANYLERYIYLCSPRPLYEIEI